MINSIFNPSDTCVKHLDAWIEPLKKKIHEENIKGPNNSPEVLNDFIDEMSKVEIRIRFALKEPNENMRNNTLKHLGWPDELIECTKDIAVRTEILDRLNLWCRTYTLRSDLLTVQKENNEI
jgi:hypothetical protein